MDTIAVVRPKVIDNVLVNPGIGFMTFLRRHFYEKNRIK
jgi:hypothetical protein